MKHEDYFSNAEKIMQRMIDYDNDQSSHPALGTYVYQNIGNNTIRKMLLIEKRVTTFYSPSVEKKEGTKVEFVIAQQFSSDRKDHVVVRPSDVYFTMEEAMKKEFLR